MQITVLGMHRSGTSIVARLLNMMGAYFAPEGQEMAIQSDNPKGFWERTDVMELNDEILTAGNATWDDIANFNLADIDQKRQTEFDARIKNLVLRLDSHRPWMIKDPRLCLTFPMWRPHLEMPVCVHVYRNPIQVAQSLFKRNGLPIHYGIALWEAHSVSSLNASNGLPRMIVRHQTMLKDPAAMAQMIYDQLTSHGVVGLRMPSSKEIEAFVSMELVHATASDEEFPGYLNGNQLRLVNGFQDGSAVLKDSEYETSPSTIELLEHYHNYHQDIRSLGDTLADIRDENAGLSEQNTGLADALNRLNSEKIRLSGELEKRYEESVAEQERLKKLVESKSAELESQRDELSAALDSKSHELTREIERLNALVDSRTYELATEREQSKALINAKSHEFAMERERLMASADAKATAHEAELDRVHALLDSQAVAFEQQREQMTKHLQAATGETEETRRQLTAKISDQSATLHAVESDFAEYRQKSEDMDKWLQSQITQMDRWLQDLAKCIEVTYGSIIWKFTRFMSRLLRLIVFWRKHRPVEFYAKRTLEDYWSWRVRAQSSKIVADPERMPDEMTPTKIGIFFRLLLFAVRHPLRTIRLMDPHMIKSARDVFFRQSSEQAASASERFFNVHDPANRPSTNPLLPTRSVKPGDRRVRFTQTENPEISIIVPVYNKFDVTMNCLESILRNTAGIPYEVIIADDASTDETSQIGSHVDNVTAIRREENGGFLRNCNHSANAARGRYLLFLNNDTEVQSNWLSELIQTFNEEPLTGLVGPKFLAPNGTIGEAGGIIWSNGTGWNYGTGDEADKPEYNYLKEVDYVSGACFLITKELWELIGGFDARFAPAYYEDTDLAFEVRKRGYKVMYQPRAVVVHVEGVSHGKDEEHGIKRYQAINREKFVRKWSDILKAEQFPGPKYLYLARDRSHDKSTILVIDHYVPQFDRDAGSKSTFQYLQLFAETDLNVKFLGDNFYRDEPYTTVLQQLGIEVLYGNWYATHWQKWLKEHAHDLDYVYLHRPHIAAKYIDLLRKLDGPKIIYQGHDLHYLRLRRQYEVDQDPKILKLAEEWRKQEYEIFSKSDVVYYFSDVEIDEIKTYSPDVVARQIPLNIMDYAPKAINSTTYEERADILFVGGFNHQPNVDAIYWFVTDVFPKILQQDNSIRLIVIGSNMPKAIASMGSENIQIIGEISDEELVNWYMRCRLSVVPLRFGAGVKGKVLEAMNLGVPVITTEIGAEGLPGHRDYLMIANDAHQLATCVLEVYSDKETWMRIVESGKMAIRDHFSKEVALNILSHDIQIDARRSGLRSAIDKSPPVSV